MKILIADDEELVRVGLTSILRNIAQADEVFEAVNGRTLIEKAIEVKPDICFVDIKMPGISGLDAIETLADDFPDTSWIILSGHSDFKYARKALSLGAVDYLLKPATESEVEEALFKATEKRQDAGRIKREKFEYRVGGVINNSSAVEFDQFLQQMENYAALIFIPGDSEAGFSVEMLRRFVYKLRERLDQNPPHDYAGAFNVLDGYPAIIAAGSSPEDLLKELEIVVPEADMNSVKEIATPTVQTLPELLRYIETAPELKEIDNRRMGDESPARSSIIVRRAEELVLQQYTEPVGVAQIADKLNVTPNYLSSLFKRYKQVSFTKFITDIRLNEALQLLKTPGITVKEAASGLGYMSSRHFTRLFRERYGMTPTDYISKNS